MSYQPGTSITLVARRNAVNANLVFSWQWKYRERKGLVPVVVEADGLRPVLVCYGNSFRCRRPGYSRGLLSSVVGGQNDRRIRA